MGAADSRSQGVGGVVGCGNGIQSQKEADHLLNLTFIRFPAANYRLFYDIGRIFSHNKTLLGQGQGKDSPGFRHGNSAGYVTAKVEGFHRRLIGLVGFQNGAKLAVNKKKTFHPGAVRLRFDTTMGNIPESQIIEFNNPPT
jgi:hypothetical protein